MAEKRACSKFKAQEVRDYTMPKTQFLFPVYPTTAVYKLGVHLSSGLGTSRSGSACQEPNVTAVTREKKKAKADIL